MFNRFGSLVWQSSGFSWETYDGGCGACHGDGFAGFPQVLIPLLIAPHAMRIRVKRPQRATVQDVTLLVVTQSSAR